MLKVEFKVNPNPKPTLPEAYGPEALNLGTILRSATLDSGLGVLRPRLKTATLGIKTILKEIPWS